MPATRPRKFGRGSCGILGTTCTSLHPQFLAEPSGALVRPTVTTPVKRSSHNSVRELESAVLEFIDVHNEQPKPFVWTKSADAILNSIGRFPGEAKRDLGATMPTCHE